MRTEGVYFGQAPSLRKNGREASSATFLQSLELPHARHQAENPIRTSASMIKAHFMDEHPIRTSTSMKQRHFMDEEPIDDCLATPGCHREASRRGCRAEVRPKHRQETGLTPIPDSLATCLYPRSGSVEGPRAKGSIDVPFATPGCHREASRRGCRVKVRPKHRQETGLRLVGRCFGTCPCPRSTSVDGPRAKGSIDVPFATRGWH